MQKATNKAAKTDATLDDLVGQVSSLASATAELLEATNVSKDKIDAAVPSAEQAIDSAAKALADANRADAAADRAEEISGIETVQDALRAAAVPLPDFHLPLNDNLMIREGIGTPYQEGIPLYHADFTRSSAKTYVSKSGELKIARINEPAFEQEGVLIEGSSTNLLPNFLLKSSGFSKVTSKIDGRFPVAVSHVVKTQKGAGHAQTDRIITCKTSNEYTASCWLEEVYGVGENVSIYINPGSVRHNMRDTGKRIGLFKKYELSFTTPDILQDVSIRIGDYNQPHEYYAVGFQIEELHFASSYISTDGLPATRAADLLLCDGSYLQGLNLTIAYSADVIGYMAGNDAASEQHAFSSFAGTIGYIRHAIRWRYDNRHRMFWGGSTYKDIEFSYDALLTTKYTLLNKGLNYLESFVNGKSVGIDTTESTKKTGTTFLSIGSDGSGSPNTQLFGHIKDFRIWNHALTPEQIAALGNPS